MKEKIKLFMKKLRKMPDFNRVKFVFLFGSYAYREPSKLSDIDFAVYHEGNDTERFKFRMRLLGNLPDNFDVQGFQDLSLYVSINILKGKLLYTDDEAFVYDQAYKLIKRFDDFKKYHEDYLESWPKII